jgi:hypothetical protein
MALHRGPKIIKDGLVLCLDAADRKSYSGSGIIWYDRSGNKNNFSGSSSTYTYPSFVSNGAASYFSFINNGTTINNMYCSSPITSTSTQTQYTRFAWFYVTALNGSWSPILQNEIGNNCDMGLTVSSGGYIQFRQYVRTGNNGTTDGDYGVLSTNTVSLNRWNFAAISVNLSARTVSFYINGNFDSTATNINVIGNSYSNNMLIGGAQTDSYSGDRMFKGRIAAVGHYNRILSAAEVSQNFNAQRYRFGV